MTSISLIDKHGVSLVEAMAIYVNSGTVVPLLAPAEGIVGAAHLRRVCIELLSWLKARAKLPRMTVMKLVEVGSAQSALISLMQADNMFSSVFSIENDGVVLNHDFKPVDVEKIASTAAALYQPQRFVTRKHGKPEMGSE